MTPRLMSTKDYSKFRLCQFNRSVTKTDALRDSMRHHGFIPAYPVHCVKEGDAFSVKAGHHRFEVAKELGLAIYYVISDDSATIHELETATTRWSVEDYLSSYIRCGIESYTRLKEYWTETGIPLGMCISILAGESARSSNKLRSFKDGSFTIKGQEHADQIRQIVMRCSELGVTINQNFVAAISRCLRVEEFSIETFLFRAASNATTFKKCRTIEDQMKLLEDIYNYKAHNKIALCFLADQIMRKRSPFHKQKT